MTTEIARFMRRLEDLWDAHLTAVVQRRDLVGALEPLAAEPSVRNLPAMTGADDRQDVERFYASDLLPHLPDDLAHRRISRTVDRFRLVEEMTVSFTHDRVMPWLLPGAEPTHARAEVLAIAVVSFERAAIKSLRVLWDHATLSAQLGLGDRVPVAVAPAAGPPHG